MNFLELKLKKHLLKRLFPIFLSALLLASMFTAVGLYSQLHEVKVIDASTGELVFEEEAGNFGDLAGALISDNENFTIHKDSSITGSTAPQSRVKLKSDNVYLISQSTMLFPSPQKCVLSIEYEDGYDYNLMSWVRGRGS